MASVPIIPRVNIMSERKKITLSASSGSKKFFLLRCGNRFHSARLANGPWAQDVLN